MLTGWRACGQRTRKTSVISFNRLIDSGTTLEKRPVSEIYIYLLLYEGVKLTRRAMDSNIPLDKDTTPGRGNASGEQEVMGYVETNSFGNHACRRVPIGVVFDSDFCVKEMLSMDHNGSVPSIDDDDDVASNAVNKPQVFGSSCKYS